MMGFMCTTCACKISEQTIAKKWWYGLELYCLPATLKARENLIQKLRKQIARGIPIIGAGAGTGISAKFEEEGGADLIVIYNSGRFRMAGRGSLAGLMPFKDANAVVLEMASEVLPVSACSTIPVCNWVFCPFWSIHWQKWYKKDLCCDSDVLLHTGISCEGGETSPSSGGCVCF